MSVNTVYRLKPSSVTAISIWGVVLVAIIGWAVSTNPTSDGWTLFGVLLALSSLQIAYLTNQRAEFTPNSFVYRSWGKQFVVPYGDISSIYWFRGPRSHFSAVIETHQGSSYTFPLKLFPEEVRRRLDHITRQDWGH